MSQEEYEVEAIVDHNITKLGRKYAFNYYIKWLNYSSAENTWEKEKDVFAKNLIQEYWDTKPDDDIDKQIYNSLYAPNKVKRNTSTKRHTTSSKAEDPKKSRIQSTLTTMTVQSTQKAEGTESREDQEYDREFKKVSRKRQVDEGESQLEIFSDDNSTKRARLDDSADIHENELDSEKGNKALENENTESEEKKTESEKESEEEEESEAEEEENEVEKSVLSDLDEGVSEEDEKIIFDGKFRNEAFAEWEQMAEKVEYIGKEIEGSPLFCTVKWNDNITSIHPLSLVRKKRPDLVIDAFVELFDKGYKKN
ncbi:hypothetical protein BDB01DRAFT_796999 [Pilobolus umbonatus]|nr:hypothetical protein BDB01DRAFT_796999 [Pilobolus umbonatus]